MPPPADAPTVLLVPPAGVGTDYWRAVQAHLHPGLTTVVFECDAAVNDLRVDAARLAAQLRGDRGDLLVGAGLGGLLARLAAAHVDAPVVRLVLLDATSEWFGEDPGLPDCLRADLHAELGSDVDGRQLKDLLDELRRRPELGAIPDTRCFVVARGLADWPVRDLLARRAMHLSWMDCQRRLAAATSSAVFLLADGCGHHIAQDDPRFVAQLITSALC